MVFDKIKASVGIGNATVDTRLDQAEFQPGEEFSAEIHVEGGDADQEIEGLKLQLMVEMRESTDEPATTKTLDTWHLHDHFTIHEGEKRVLDFEGRLHHETPITEANFPTNMSKVWIRTGADIDNAIDPKDKDYLRIKPTPAMRAMMDAIEQSGFRPDRLTVDPDRIKVGDLRADLNCDQEFCYRPGSGSRGGHGEGSRSSSRSSRGGLEEIEVHFVPREHATHVLIEFDYRSRSEQFRSMVIDHDDYSVDGLAQEFQNVVDRMS